MSNQSHNIDGENGNIGEEEHAGDMKEMVAERDTRAREMWKDYVRYQNNLRYSLLQHTS